MSPPTRTTPGDRLPGRRTQRATRQKATRRQHTPTRCPPVVPAVEAAGRTAAVAGLLRAAAAGRYTLEADVLPPLARLATAGALWAARAAELAEVAS